MDKDQLEISLTINEKVERIQLWVNQNGSFDLKFLHYTAGHPSVENVVDELFVYAADCSHEQLANTFDESYFEPITWEAAVGGVTIRYETTPGVYDSLFLTKCGSHYIVRQNTFKVETRHIDQITRWVRNCVESTRE